MMQNLNRKNSFEDYGTEPSPLVWEKIEKQLPPPKNKKRIWFIWSAAAILVTGLFLSAYFFDIKITLKKKETAEIVSASSSKKINDDANKSVEKSQTQSDGNKNVVEKNKEHVKESLEKNIAKKESTAVEHTVAAQAQRSKVKGRMRNEKEVPAAQNETAFAGKKTGEENKSITETISTVNETLAAGTYIENAPSISTVMVPASLDSLQMLRAMLMDFQPVKKKYAVSRWQWSAAGGKNYNYRVLDFSSAGNNQVSEGEKNYLSDNERGIQTIAFETQLGYSFSTHFSLNFGIHYFTAGQERTQSEIVLSSGVAGTPNTQYDVSTSAGVVAADGPQVDQALFNSSDTSLFAPVPLTITGNPTPDSSSSVIQYFTLRQEFSFIGFPLLVQYQPTEHRFTPFIGLGCSAGYLWKERVTMNDKDVKNSYRQSTNDIVFFAEAQAGVKYRISNHLFFKLQPSFRYGLNSMNGDDNIKWIPYSTGIGAGFTLKF